MRYPEATVGAVILNSENEVLICKSNKWNQKYVIPGGHIEAGEGMEEFTANLLRELKKGDSSKYKQEIIYGL